MIDAGRGSIIDLSSIYGLVGSPGCLAHHASKGAVRVTTQSAALEYPAEGICVRQATSSRHLRRGERVCRVPGASPTRKR
jgi:short-subunit dehydrogenase